MPHLQRAARIGWHIQRADLLCSVTAELLEDNPVGILLFDREGRVALANRAARAMAGRADAYAIRQGKVIGLSLHNDRQLRRLMTAAMGQASEVTAPRGGVVRLKRKSGARGYVVAIGPLGLGTSPFQAVAPAVFMLVSDSEIARLPRQAMLQQVFGLTVAEACLAMQLAAGQSIEQAAELLSVRCRPRAGTWRHCFARPTPRGGPSSFGCCCRCCGSMAAGAADRVCLRIGADIHLIGYRSPCPSVWRGPAAFHRR
jgi:PAS domain-containing protein